MGMRIDKARRDNQIGCVDNAARAVADLADLRDPALLNRHVGAAPERAGPVNHSSVANHDVVRHSSRSPQSIYFMFNDSSGEEARIGSGP